MATQQPPQSLQQLANSPELLQQLRQTGLALARKLKQDPQTAQQYLANPAQTFLAQAPQPLQQAVSSGAIAASDQILKADAGAAGAKMLSDVQAGGDVHKGFLSACCQVGLWAAVVVALAGVIALTQGAAIAPLIALDAGLLTVLAAITGLSEGAIAALAAGGTFTLGQLIDAACD